jgi:hypothetical protein
MVLWWVQRSVTRCELDHVSVASRGVVLDPSVLRGDTLYPEITYVKAHNALAWMIEVPCLTKTYEQPTGLWQVCHKPPPLLNRDPRPKTPIRAFLRWLTRGRVYSRDCVTRVAGVLDEAGHAVPRWVVTPDHLYDWLRSQGHPQHEL